jgi:hypothetical protein
MKMELDWKGIFEKIVVGLVVTAVIGLVALFWNWGSQGGLVHVLGGVTQKEFEEIGKRPSLPPGAVVAFDLRDGCPEGWVVVKSAIERVIVGAATGAATNAMAEVSEVDAFPFEYTSATHLPLERRWKGHCRF